MSDAAAVIERLRRLRAGDAPTHGGRVLSYVYDSGRAELDELADRAASLARPLNGLDPTVFPSIAAMERDLVGFARDVLHGGRGVVGSVTSGGTESCLLAVKTAHAAFQKAARLFDLEWDPVPCGPDGAVRPADVIARFGDDVALLVLSAPAYPTGILDPIAEVAPVAAARGIPCHVDACFGGFVLPWWPGLPRWDLRVRGVTSVSADLHKFGYAPKGVSVLLHRGRRRHRAQFFATTRWPGYPVVNPTLLGSRSASPLAAAWAVVQHLGPDGYAQLTGSIVRTATAIRTAAAGIRGLSVLGDPVGPAIALVADETLPPDERVDPHRLADALTGLGWRIQHQPGFVQADGTRLPRTAHLTLTPVLERSLAELTAALSQAADAVRGRTPADPRLLRAALRALGYGPGGRVPGPRAAGMLLRLGGAGTVTPGQPMADLMALIEGLPAPVAEALLTELLARVSEP